MSTSTKAKLRKANGSLQKAKAERARRERVEDILRERISVRPFCVSMQHGGEEGAVYGDVLTRLHVDGDRRKLADELEALARFIRFTQGDLAGSSDVFILRRK